MPSNEIIVGTGRLYLAPAAVDTPESAAYYAGTTCGSCALVSTEQVHAALDEAGRPAALLTYGGTAAFSGMLLTFDADVLSRLFGADVSGGALRFGGQRASNLPIQAVFVQDMARADGQRFVIRLRGVCTSGFSMTFSGQSESGIAFEIRAVSDADGNCVSAGFEPCMI